MAPLRISSRILPEHVLAPLRELVTSATNPDSMGELGPSPYRVTFWYPLALAPRNVVEDVVRDHLHPLLPAAARHEVIGVEWWLGRLAPPYAANFEFGAHRDFGAHPVTGALESPLLSSVFYLSTVDDGPLVVFGDEAPRGRAGASAHHFPVANTFAVFPGHLWHAILSREDLGAPRPPAMSDGLRVTVTVNWWPYRPAGEASPPMKIVAADYDGSIYPQLRVRLCDLEGAPCSS